MSATGRYVIVAINKDGHSLAFGPFYYLHHALDYLQTERRNPDAKCYQMHLGYLNAAERTDWYGNKSFYKNMRPVWKRNRKLWRSEWQQLMSDLPLGG